MEAPAHAVDGRIRGREYQFREVRRDALGLQFLAGPVDAPEAELRVVLPVLPSESLDGRAWEVRPSRTARPGAAFVVLATLPATTKSGAPIQFTNNYALKVALAPMDEDRTVSGTIYFCTHDESRSVVAGRFQAKVAPPPMLPGSSPGGVPGSSP